MINVYARRGLAYIIDILLAILPLAIYSKLFGQIDEEGERNLKGFWVGPVFILLIFLYYVIQEYYWQQTVGKRIFKLKLVKMDGSKPTFLQVSQKHFFDFFELLLFPFIPFFVVILNKRNQRIGDIVAKTQVVDTGPD